jgi:hypothetical protein
MATDAKVKTELLELADCCEAATGLSAKLDHEIRMALKINHTRDRYTASLDAAMTLKPEGWRVGTLGEDTNGKQIAHLVERATGERICSYANTLPGALCAAALRARLNAKE